tara:strand:- start:1 stop:117 length:117 start_codon:yes stop_codon:yes gene_type:complete
LGNHIASKGLRLPFSAKALDITKNIINAKAKLKPRTIR